MYALDDYDFILPEDRIAQIPVKQRDQSRLLVLNRYNGSISHHRFTDITDLLLPTDILVVNNTEVIPGRLFGQKETGGKVEILLLDYDKAQPEGTTAEMQCLIKASKQLKVDARFQIGSTLSGRVKRFENGIYTVQFEWSGNFEEILHAQGRMPLPPYIRRDRRQIDEMNDKKTYQTVYATQKGAIAAPTAGLHFTEEMLAALKAKGVRIVAITLHVGYGTFLPVRAADIRQHKMHSERFWITQTTADTINQAKKEGHRIIAVGTTTVRTLEYLALGDTPLAACNGECDLFIYPGFKFKLVGGMITNFHLPKSSLMMLVSAFAGIGNIMKAYKIAVSERYRFFSYGDATFLH